MKTFVPPPAITWNGSENSGAVAGSGRDEAVEEVAREDAPAGIPHVKSVRVLQLHQIGHVQSCAVAGSQIPREVDHRLVKGIYVIKPMSRVKWITACKKTFISLSLCPE